MPRYLAAEYPGTKSTVLEIDPTVLKTGRERLGLHTSGRAAGARSATRASASVDAPRRLDRPRRRRRVRQPLGALAPHHAGVRRATSIGCSDRAAIYMQNVIDYPPFRFARAELATLRSTFDCVAAIGPPVDLRRPLRRQRGAGRIRPPARRARARAARGDARRRGASTATRLDRFVDNAPVIRDDFAPDRPVARRRQELSRRDLIGCDRQWSRELGEHLGGVGTELGCRPAERRGARRRSGSA